MNVTVIPMHRLALRTLTAFGAASLLVAGALAAQSEPDLLLVGRARLDRKQTLEHASFAIQQGRIVEVEKRKDASMRSQLRGTQRWSFPDGYATAGFVDVHSGLGAQGELGEEVVAFYPQFEAAEAYDPAHPGWAQLPRRGVTSLVLAPSDSGLVGGLAAFVRPGAFARPDESYLKFSLTDSMLNREREPTSLLGAVDLLERRFAEIEQPQEGAPAPLGEGMQRFAQAIGGGRPVAIAARTPAQILQALQLVRTHRLRAFLLHATEAETVLDDLAASGLGVVLEPLGFESTDRARRLPRLLAQKGIRFAIAGEGDTRSELPRLQTSLALMVASGVEPTLALSAVTDEAARFAGLEDHVGSLLRGRDADLVVWSHPPYDLRARPLLVLRRGEVLYEAPGRTETVERTAKPKGADL